MHVVYYTVITRPIPFLPVWTRSIVPINSSVTPAKPPRDKHPFWARSESHASTWCPMWGSERPFFVHFSSPSEQGVPVPIHSMGLDYLPINWPPKPTTPGRFSAVRLASPMTSCRYKRPIRIRSSSGTLRAERFGLTRHPSWPGRRPQTDLQLRCRGRTVGTSQGDVSWGPRLPTARPSSHPTGPTGVGWFGLATRNLWPC